MDEKRTDRRVIKTKRAIRKAFGELLGKKNINNITIKDIADLADINRKTFYNYYNGVHELMEEIENEIIDAFDSRLEDFDFNIELTRPVNMFDKLTQLEGEEGQFFAHLMLSENNSQLRDKIIGILKTKTVKFFSEKYDADKYMIEIVTNYITGGITNVFQNWYNSEQKIPKEYVAEIITKLITNGMSAFASDVGKNKQ